jgi:hypothetical protein
VRPGATAARNSLSPRARLALASGLSLALNLTGITWGLPARWHPDEKADVAARMARGEGLAPDSFINPSLPLYAMLPPLFIQDGLRRAGALAGSAADPLLLGRILSAGAGAGAVFLLGVAVGRTHPQLGALPAVLLALCPGFVNLCHFATPEAWYLLGTSATLLLALRHLGGCAPAWAVGLALGLTASTKYTAAALLVPVLAAVWLRPGGEANATSRRIALGVGLVGMAVGLALLQSPGVELASRLHLGDVRLLHPAHAQSFVRGVGGAALLGGAAVALLAYLSRTRPAAARLVRLEVVAVGLSALVGFLIGTPFAAMRPLAFLSDLAFNDQTRFEYKGLVGASTSYLPYLGLLGDALTWPLLASALAGALVLVHRIRGGDRPALVLLLAALSPYVLVASSGHQAMRFLAPVLPPAAWIAALGLRALVWPKARPWVSGLVAARAALGTLLVLRLFFVDSRILASRWIERNVPVGATLDLIANNPGYAPQIPEGRTLRLVPTLSREMAPPERFAEAAAGYPAEAAPWLVLTASFYERFLEHPEQRPERARFFRELLEGRGGFEVAARFRQEGWLHPPAEFVDPEIVILRKKQEGTGAAPGA